LNDTHIEADLRLRHTPPELEVLEVSAESKDVVQTYRKVSARAVGQWGKGI
jgi:hypothetical protein